MCIFAPMITERGKVSWSAINVGDIYNVYGLFLVIEKFEGSDKITGIRLSYQFYNYLKDTDALLKFTDLDAFVCRLINKDVKTETYSISEFRGKEDNFARIMNLKKFKKNLED